MAEEACLVIIKPDGLVKSLTGDIITKLSQADLKIIGTKVVNVTKELAEEHYSNLYAEQVAKHGKKLGTKIFEETMKYIQGEFHTDRVFALVYHGEDAITKIRTLAGSTNPEKANFTTIRGKYGRIHSETGVFENVIHVSDSEESSEREIQLWFTPEELTMDAYPTETKEITMDKKVWKSK